MPDVIGLTRELVAIPSHRDESAVGDRIERWLREHTDAHVSRDGVGNVIARRGGGERSLALVGHHDVVPPAETQLDGEGYRVETRDGRLYGRGTADMKGALAAMLLAFAEAEPPGELVFASFVGEEVGGRGARAALDGGFRVDGAVVGEGSTGYSAPGVTDVVVAHRGRREGTVLAGGTAAHASEPDRGENAIYRACEAIERLRDMVPPRVEVAGEELAGSVAVTTIEGGSAANVVPDRCEVTVDERTVPGERLPLGKLAELPGIEWSVGQDLPPMRCGDEAFATTMLEAATAAQGGSPRAVTKPHATDAGWLSRAGIPCVVCGPAERGEAHTAGESVGIEVLRRCRRIYRAMVETATGGGR